MSLVPEPVARIGELMSSFEPWWALCGGWAVDSWLGRETREHGDLDIMVFEDDQRALFDHLAGWHLVAHDPNVAGDTTALWDGRRLDLPAHVHARPRDGLNLEALQAWVKTPGERVRDDANLEVIFNERSGGRWVLSRELGISLPLERAAEESPWGLPTLVPEALMFYKATAYIGEPGMKPRRRDEADFRALLPTIDDGRRAWLRQATSLVPRHEWLAQLNL